MCLHIYSFSVFPYVDVVVKPQGIYKLCFLLLKYSAAYHQSFYFGSTVFICAPLTAAKHSVTGVTTRRPTVGNQVPQLALP